MKKATLALSLLLVATPAFAQIPNFGKIKKEADKAADKIAELNISEKDERTLGESVSTKIRAEFGVYQNVAVTKYVSLVGSTLAQASTRPGLKWQFIVLDTDGVNAFAAPGGIVHITRGALGLIKSEAELAGVLGHEISHVSKKHTINAIKKSKVIKAGTDELGRDNALAQQLANAAYDNIIENAYDRGDEEDADQEGIRLAARAGYAPAGLATFLTKLMIRNQGSDTRNALFASHPEAQGRIDKIARQIKSERLGGTAVVEARYKTHITWDATPVSQIATTGASGAKGVAEGGTSKDGKKEEPKKKGFGLDSLKLSSGKQAESTQASASAGGRAVGGGADRMAKGGSNPAVVPVTITPAEIDAFRRGIA